jgi:hypothetical protein
VVEGCGRQPAAASPALSRSRSAAMSATRSRASESFESRAAPTATDTTETEPGGRYTAISSISSGLAMANPTRSPAIP